MKILLLLLALTASLWAGDQSKRIHEIEFKFTMKFDQEMDVGGIPVWLFYEPSLNTHVNILGVIVPVNATDKQVAECERAAQFAFGWYEGSIMKWIKQKKEQAAQSL